MFNHVLVPLDTSFLAECVLDHAVALAKRFGSRITLVTVVDGSTADETGYATDPLQWRLRKTEHQAYLDGVCERLKAFGLAPDTVLLEGNVPESLLSFVHEADVDLILLSSHGKSGLSRWNVSSVSQKIISQAAKSILLVRAYKSKSPQTPDIDYNHIIVPLDGSQRAECVLPWVEALVRDAEDSQVILAHVIQEPRMLRQLEQSKEDRSLYQQVMERNLAVASTYLEQLQERLTVNTSLYLEESHDIAKTLHQLATHRDADLMVISAHGQTGSRKWHYGSVTTTLIAYMSVPLLIIQDLSPEEVEPTDAELASRERSGH